MLGVEELTVHPPFIQILPADFDAGTSLALNIGTGEVADVLAGEFPDRVEVIHRTGIRGLGRSYTEGLARAVRSSADVICQMDADLSHDPKNLSALVAATQGLDLVIASRYCPGGDVVNWPLKRMVLTRRTVPASTASRERGSGNQTLPASTIGAAASARAYFPPSGLTGMMPAIW